MTNPSLGRRKSKITITASPKGVKIAENALVRLGFDSKINFAKSQIIAPNTVTKFFRCKPIQPDSFKRICDALKLNWQEIYEGIEEESEQLERIDCSSPDINEGEEQTQIIRCRFVICKSNKTTIKGVIELEGDINLINNDFQAVIESLLRESSGDTVKIEDIKEGSIKIFIKGSQEDIERLVSLINSGEITTINGLPVKDIQVLSESSDDDKSTESDNKWHASIKDYEENFISLINSGELTTSSGFPDEDIQVLSDDKWRLVQEIVSEPREERRLINTDLSDADLSGACLRYAYLRNVNLSDADLSGADLSGAYLSHVNLSNADLSDADLSGGYVDFVDFSGAEVKYVNLNNMKKFCILTSEIADKLMLVSEILDRPSRDQSLSGVDLSYTKLSDANLSGVDLRDADLSGTDLRRAYLCGADLSGADLSDADLSDADLSSTIVTNALFGGSLGLTEDMKRDLESRGAIFGDRPPVPVS
ncbi:putative protein YjbI, containings pentapeptide repeats [Nostoc flagelliforme CCNUN1]|uniref:TRADD-like N-terminal domain-containing protein n=1 Tax=Nostoc flagelliforme CCNUN1 TaxID=2038116 RepID=A0A2K8T245_9NOSO|nr:pentapeptide repeat-containing protein [Nostoc flagelliforme]AUB41700.1 putative protein YjbI, containings pentapeptide repeats [Nostoc flagelliforme CCNUN1]